MRRTSRGLWRFLYVNKQGFLWFKKEFDAAELENTFYRATVSSWLLYACRDMFFGPQVLFGH